MARRRKSSRPQVQDWHLWTEVTRSITPIKRPQSGNKAKVKSEPAPQETFLQEPYPFEPTKPDFTPKSAGGKLFANQANSQHKPFQPGAHSQNSRTAAQNSTPPNGMEPRLRRRVRRGQLPIDGTIDLHGLRQDEARSSLLRFVARAQERGHRTILVITGKGLKKTGPETIFERGVLRHMLPIWLSEPQFAQMVSGLEISAPHHGGEGAYYVRIKPNRG